jgi:hypothetical protein
MVNSRILKLEDMLSKEETDVFNMEWSMFEEKNKLSSPYEVHNAFPVISKIYQFRDKLIFRAKVFQRRDYLRKINPYHNAPFYLIPFWHAYHYVCVAEQIYHAATEKFRPNNQKYIVKDLPYFDLNKPIYWPAKHQGHISAVGLIKLRRGSWERGNAIETYTCHFIDDKSGEDYGSAGGLCLVGFRSYVQTMNNLKAGNPEAAEKLIRSIQGQEISHSRLYKRRDNLTICADELIETIRNGRIPNEEAMDDFFSLYEK